MPSAGSHIGVIGTLIRVPRLTPCEARTARRLRGDRCVCAPAQHRLRGVAKVITVRVRVIARVGRLDRSTTPPAGEWLGTVGRPDVLMDTPRQRLRGNAEVHGYALVLLHGPVNALTDIPRLLRGGEMLGGAAAACHTVGTGPGREAPRSRSFA